MPPLRQRHHRHGGPGVPGARPEDRLRARGDAIGRNDCGGKDVSQFLAANDTRSVFVNVVTDDVEGGATATCEGCGWVTDPERGYSFEDVAQAAGIHLDQEHP